MDKNSQDSVGSETTIADGKLWLPPVSPHIQKKQHLFLNFQKKRTPIWKRLLARTGIADKTLWDWPNLLAILAVPLIVGFATIAVTTQQASLARQQQNTDVAQQATQVAAQAQLQATQVAANAAQAKDQQYQTTFDNYIGQISALLLVDHLQTSEPGSPVRAVAEARTLTAIENLDSVRQVALVRFLWLAGLASGNRPVISLNGAYLEYTQFQHALLNNINLSGALLPSSAFDDCDLHGAIFTAATLLGAILNNVNLAGANLVSANLYGATLEDVTLTGTNMAQALLHNAILSGDDLTTVNLTGADLSGANLKGAMITPDQLKQVASLQGAIMPDVRYIHRCNSMYAFASSGRRSNVPNAAG